MPRKLIEIDPQAYRDQYGIVPVAPVCDWYQATVHGVEPEVLIAKLCEAINERAALRRQAEQSEEEEGFAPLGASPPIRVEHIDKGLHGYQCRSMLWEGVPADVDPKKARSARPVCRILHGGQAPNITFSGVDARDGMEIIRSLWPEHNVTRCDVAYDWLDWPGGFEQLTDCAWSIVSLVEKNSQLPMEVKGRGIKPRHSVDGRTEYIGSRKSDFIARVYEKGYERAAKSLYAKTDDDGEVVRDQFGRAVAENPNWVRYEVEIHPKKEAKALMSTMKLEDMAGASSWARLLCQVVNDNEAAPFDIDPRSETSLEKTHVAYMRGYSKHMMNYCLELYRMGFAEGSFDTFTEMLRQALYERGLKIGHEAAPLFHPDFNKRVVRDLASGEGSERWGHRRDLSGKAAGDVVDPGNDPDVPS